jgi:phosphatidylglycerol:prolipoprotein diacylglycerol transferase
MGIGWGIGFNITQSYWEKFNLQKKDLWLLFLGTFVAGWIGAKVFFLIFSTPERALDYSKEVNFWLGGGFVFYGGLIFSALFALLFSFINKAMGVVDLALITPGLALGHAIGRVGCLLAGCCYGTHCDLPFAISFKGQPRHPVQLYEVFGLLVIFFLLRKFIKKEKLGSALNTYAIGYAALRFVLEYFRGDEIRGVFDGLSTSQWISLVLITFIVLSNLLVKKVRNH